MKKRLLGRTGLQVTELSMGGLFVSKFGAAFDDARRAVHRAFELQDRIGIASWTEGSASTVSG